MKVYLTGYWLCECGKRWEWPWADVPTEVSNEWLDDHKGHRLVEGRANVAERRGSSITVRPRSIRAEVEAMQWPDIINN